jgi:nucleoid DNA-binding protein
MAVNREYEKNQPFQHRPSWMAWRFASSSLPFVPGPVRHFAGFSDHPHRAMNQSETQKPMTLTKRDLVVRISEETGLIQTQVFDVVQKTLDYIAEALAKGDKVELRNFGVFEVKIRKARVGRNPNKPEVDVPIPARSMVKFKAGKEMRAEVLKLATKA